MTEILARKCFHCTWPAYLCCVDNGGKSADTARSTSVVKWNFELTSRFGASPVLRAACADGAEGNAPARSPVPINTFFGAVPSVIADQQSLFTSGSLNGRFVYIFRSVPVTLFRISRVISFDEYTRQGSSKLYLKCNLCGTFLLLKADRTSPRMIEHWGEDKCKKTSKRSERRRENELEVQMAEIAHNEAFGSGACTPLESTFI